MSVARATDNSGIDIPAVFSGNSQSNAKTTTLQVGGDTIDIRERVLAVSWQRHGDTRYSVLTSSSLQWSRPSC